MLFLAEPSIAYQASFILSLQEFQAEGLLLNYNLSSIANDFGTLLQRLRDQQDQSNLKPGLVPQSEFWLIDNDEFIGRTSIRHELNEFLCKFGGHIGYMIRPSKRW